MSMRSDFEKVMQARRNVRLAATLPERFYAVLCYQSVALEFFEQNRESIERMLPPPKDSVRWII